MNTALPTTSQNFAGVVGQLVGLMNSAVPVLVGLALLAFFYGLIRFIYSSSDTHAHTEGYKFMVQGLVAIFVIVALWGIIKLMQQAVFPTSALSTVPPGLVG